MKVLFVSDNHGDEAILEQIRQTFGNQVSALFHCGDSNLASHQPGIQGYQTVIGNTDWGLDYPQVVTEQVDDQVVTVTHGHLYQVNMTLTPLLLLGQETHADIIAYGHTHQLAVTMEEQRLFINPGSISFPRGTYTGIGGTFAIVDANSQRFIVQYYDRQMHAVPDLHFKFER
ncbi:YfcE family phosphodiesterase [Limosilactobacillus caecicola]|uniref:YfcE family phosphodiesterase n=1 Tax=Limosilactobacillus caecicola TaxID=2941332 RepID=UPI00203EE935|nr:metallophosphoesterase [Limosilactobacillus caecicola]